MKDKNVFLKIFGYFSIWRISLFVVAVVAGILIANFGGRFPYVDRVLTTTNLPNWIWGFGNFDGVHHLRLAQNGYSAEYSQAFFPLYPLLIKLFNIFPKGNLDLSLYTDPSYFYVGMVLSNLLFVFALYFLYKLWKEEYSGKISTIALILLLTFPTSFYFGSVYSESLFLLLVVLTFWFTNKNKFILAGIFAALASSTKVQGSLLFFYLLIELSYKYKSFPLTRFDLVRKGVVALTISITGLFSYMFYLWREFGNPIYFLTSQPAFGADRSSFPIITLPQVFYRYFKILTEVSPVNISFWNSLLEITVTILLIVVLIYSFKKIKFSYFLFVLLAVIVPTLTGTFSSMPRYALLAFPTFPLIAKFNKASKYIIIAQVTLLVVLVALFVRGYWVA